MITSSRYKILLRTVFSSILSSSLSSSDLRLLTDELRRGNISDELAYMLDQTTKHFISDADSSVDKDTLYMAEDLVKKRKISRISVLNIIQSLGGDVSQSGASIKQLITNYIAEASPTKIRKFIDVLQTVGEKDEFLAGISNSRK